MNFGVPVVELVAGPGVVVALAVGQQPLVHAVLGPELAVADGVVASSADAEPPPLQPDGSYSIDA